MPNDASLDDITSAIATQLPYLRRYSRAITGSQTSGDAYAIAALEAILEDRSVYDTSLSAKAALFKVMHTLWKSSNVSGSVPDDGSLAGKAHKHLVKLTPDTREALLLHTIEEFSFDEIAAIMQIDRSEAEHLVSVAHREMADSVSGRVMIIEDEAIIAMDLESVVSDIGHKITGIARTRDGAVDLASREKPDLILADIQLADNSSGIDAVQDILADHGHIPVIFITSFPERLLTGERPEPAFLISKPYSEDQVRSAVSQAMFFSSTETLKA